MFIIHIAFITLGVILFCYFKPILKGGFDNNYPSVKEKDEMTNPMNETAAERIKEKTEETIKETSKPANETATETIKEKTEETAKPKMEYTREMFLEESKQKCLKITVDSSDHKKKEFFNKILSRFSECELCNVIDFVNEYSGITLYLKTDLQTHLKTIEINPLCDIIIVYEKYPAICVGQIYDTLCVHNLYYMSLSGGFFEFRDERYCDIADDPREFLNYLIEAQCYNQNEIVDESREQYNKNDPEAVEIRRKVDILHSRYPKIILNDVISMEEVENYELINNVKLPDDYVWFITNVGDGGTWNTSSGYQINKLCYAYFSDEALPGYKIRRKRYSIDIWSKGCSYSLGIIVNGEHFGEITSNGEGMAFYYSLECRCFKELYLRWLEDALLGYDQSTFYRRIPGTIEENLELFKKYKCHSVLYNVLWKISPECITERLVSELYFLFQNETNNENRVALMKLLKNCKYEDMYSIINAIFIPENYDTIIWTIYYPEYYTDRNDEQVNNNMEIYYQMLVEITNFIAHNSHFDEALYKHDRHILKSCLKMTVMNPVFKEEDIIDFLTSDDEDIIKTLAFFKYDKKLVEHIGKYIERSYAIYEEKYNKNKK